MEPFLIISKGYDLLSTISKYSSEMVNSNTHLSIYSYCYLMGYANRHIRRAHSGHQRHQRLRSAKLPGTLSTKLQHTRLQVHKVLKSTGTRILGLE